VPIVGTSPESIHLAEDRGAFGELLREAGLPPAHGTATRFAEAKRIADEIGYPVLVRPSYVLGGAAWRSSTTSRAAATSTGPPRSRPEHPVLVDRFLDDAIEIDVDALSTATELFLGRGHGAHRGGRRSTPANPPCAAAADRRLSCRISPDRAAASTVARSPGGIGVRACCNVQ
jgi:carbamoyl-phosphate synthase large subunit